MTHTPVPFHQHSRRDGASMRRRVRAELAQRHARSPAHTRVLVLQPRHNGARVRRRVCAEIARADAKVPSARERLGVMISC